MRICRNLSSWHVQITVRAFKDKLERDQFKDAQLDLGFYTKVRKWQPLQALQGISEVFHGNCDSPLALADHRKKQFLVTEMKDSPYKFSKCSSVTEKENTNVSHDVIEE